MKAGIYVTPNGNMIYVAKDRTITATSLTPSSWVGTKVSHRAKDNTVLIASTDYRCSSYSDVPKGCTDHEQAVADAKAEYDTWLATKTLNGGLSALNDAATALVKDIYTGAAESFVGGGFAAAKPREVGRPPTLGAGYGKETSAPDTLDLRKAGYRRCHKQSARKHRKQGCSVFRAVGKAFWWKPANG